MDNKLVTKHIHLQNENYFVIYKGFFELISALVNIW